MTLDEVLQRKLDALQLHSGRSKLMIEEASGSIELVLDHVEPLSCQMWELSFTRLATTAAQNTLLARAQELAQRVTGLLEPLHLVEADGTCGRAVLRSVRPYRKNDQLFYYELLLNETGSIVLRRYQSSLAQIKRQQVSYVLTREALAKLLGDLVA